MYLQKTTVTNALAKDSGSQSNWQNVFYKFITGSIDKLIVLGGCSCAGSSTWEGGEKMDQLDGFNTV